MDRSTFGALTRELFLQQGTRVRLTEDEIDREFLNYQAQVIRANYSSLNADEQ